MADYQPLEINMSPRRGAPLRRVLIVEDEPDMRDAIQVAWSLIRPDGFGVEFAVCGGDALQKYGMAKVQANPYALIVTDIAMSPITSIAMAKEIRQSGDGVMKIVFLTGYDGALNRALAEDVNAVGYWVKPIEVGELLRRIERVL
jgi:CheY-like chemotaxis protein